MRRMQKWITVFLCICLMIMTVPENVFVSWQNAKAEDSGDDSSGSDDESDDNGTRGNTPVISVTTPQSDHETRVPDGYVAIHNISELYSIRNGLDQNYILMNDIDMSTATAPGGDYDMGNGWSPIEDFTGNFDGNGYRIIGMHIFGDMNRKNVGLFGNVSGDGSTSGNITNLGIKDCDINVSNSKKVGGIAGSWQGDGSKLTKSYVSGKICVEATEAVEYCQIGGLLGVMEGEYMTVADCYNAADIVIERQTEDIDTGFYYTGGITGEDEVTGIVYKQCYNRGVIDGGNGKGISTSSIDYGITAQSCYYLSGTAKQGLGGFSGDTFESRDKDMHIQITKINSADQMKNQVFFTNFDFNDTWEIDRFCSEYPYPQLHHNRQVRATRVEIKKLPSKLTYMQGDKTDFSDGEIEITYENGASTEIKMDDWMTSGYNMNEIGKQTVILSYAGFQTEFSIEVKEIAVTGISLEEEELTLGVLESKKIAAFVQPYNATHQTIIWESSNEEVAAVSEYGIVQAKKKGEAVITAYSFDKKKSATCKVTVIVPCVKLTIDKYDKEMDAGETQKINVDMQPLETTDKISWTSSDKSIATVDEQGNVTAVAGGKVKITATADSGVSDKCEILVKVPSTSVTLNEKEKTLQIGDSFKLTATMLPDNSTDILAWSMVNEISEDEDDADVVVIDKDGYVTAKSAGTVTIMVSTESGYTDTCKIKVEALKRPTEQTPESTENPTEQTPGPAGHTPEPSKQSSAAGTPNADPDAELETAQPADTLQEQANDVKIKISSVTKIKKNNVTLKFNGINTDKADAYQIKVKQKGKKAYIKTISVRRSYKLIKLKTKKKYTVKIRACVYNEDDDNTYYGAWSSEKSFRTR